VRPNKNNQEGEEDNDDEEDDENKKSSSGGGNGGTYWTTEGGEEDVEGNDESNAIKGLRFYKKDEDHGPAAWNKSDRDYKYPELLERVFDILNKKNPELTGSRNKHVTVKTPQVARDGPKKTIFMNFAEICDNLHRKKEHLNEYLFAEMGTTGNLDGSERLVIKGAFRTKDIESLLRKYIQEYVICKVCTSLDTRLDRDPNTRLFSINCMNCQASRTVQAVKQGYVAQTSRRKKK
jgi:translation initiation factor 2 subunit 2